jgi:hypothetical protein
VGDRRRRETGPWGGARRAARRLVALWLLLAPAWALAWDLKVVAEEGRLRAGWPGTVLVAVVDDAGVPVVEGVNVTLDGGVITRSSAATAPGVTAWTVVPVAARESVGVTVAWGGRSRTQRIAVVPWSASRLKVDEGVVVDAQRGEVSVLVRGEDLPPPEQLAVVLTEGRVRRVERITLGLRLDLELEDSPYPRMLSLGVRDTRGAELPAWGSVVVQARQPLLIETEPGATVTVRIGGREYGPLLAGERGAVRVVVDQLPEEREAEILVRDQVGNEATQTRLMTSLAQPEILALVAGTRSAGAPAPPLFLHAVDAGGAPWRGEAPGCRTPGIGSLSVLPIQTGTWVVPVPVSGGQAALDVRVRCTLADRAQVDLAIPATPGVPERLDLRLWPEELSADFPVADIAVSLLDGDGERLPFVGDVEVDATFGQVWLNEDGGPILRGEFQGDLVVEVGEGEIVASWRAPAGAGPPSRFVVAPVSVPTSGVAQLQVRALDASQRPLAGLELQVDAGAGAALAVADDRGWARLKVAVPPGAGPVELGVSAEGRTARALVVRGAWPDQAPSSADLRAAVPVRVDPGRVATVEITLDPPVVYAGPRAKAEVTARFLDRAGNLATSALPTLSTSEGTLSAIPVTPDGASRWQLTPKPGFRERKITILARSDVLDVEESAELVVRPRPVKATLGVGGGLHTNFGDLLSPTLSLDASGRIRVRSSGGLSRPSHTRLFMFGSASWYQVHEERSTGLDVVGDLRMYVLPISGGFAIRQEYPAQAFWVGLGGQVIPYWGRLNYDEQLWARGGGVLPPALTGVLGYGVRVPGGEVVAELRGSSATSPGGATSFSGFVGGLSATIGYRVIIP